QVLLAGFLMNLRFLPMSAALAPYFAGVQRIKLLLSCHFVSASSFIVPYLYFQKEREGAQAKTDEEERADGHRNLYFFLGVGTMGATRLQIIVIMGLMAFAVRALPQIFFVERKFPETWDRFLRYISYAFICSIIAITLFMTGPRFESAAAPYRAAALIVTIVI